MWFNIFERKCKCCNCKEERGRGEDKTGCPDKTCFRAERLYDDFIDDINPPVVETPKVERRKEEIAIRKEAEKIGEDVCRCCNHVFEKDYIFCNIKYTDIDIKGDRPQETRRAKIKLCKNCFETELARII